MQEDFAAIQRIDALPSTSTAPTSKATTAPTSRTFTAPAKLEPFLLLAKSARGAGAAALVDQVIAANGVFVFSEMLETKAIAELEHNDQYRQKWMLLQVYAYGNLKDYRDNASSLPAINDAQLTKLKMLTLVDLATRSRSLPYSQLLSALEISSIRVLEDLLIEAIYSDLLVGRINQKLQVLEVDSVIGRDVKLPSSSSSSVSTAMKVLPEKTIEGMMGALQGWYGRVGETLENLDHQIDVIRKHEAYNTHVSQQNTDRINKVLVDVAKAASSRDNTRDRQNDNNMQGFYNPMGGVGGGGMQALPNLGMMGDSRENFDAMGGMMDLDGDRGKRSPSKPSARKRTRP